MNSTPPIRRRRSLRLFPFCLLGLAIFGLLLPLVASPQLPVIRFVRDPDPAPDFQLKDLAGKDFSLASAHGKVILLNFWATWCGPCRAEIPSLIELQNRYKDRLQIIGLADDDDPDTVKQVVDSEGINFPVALVTNQIRIDYGGVFALPTAFIINTDGRIVQKHVGLFNPALYETEVRALLDLPIAAKVETFVDTGEIFLKHADRATLLPGVDLTKLNPEQRQAALHRFNAELCPCGCKMTLAQCRIYDRGCSFSLDRTAAIVEEILAAEEKNKAATPAPVANPVSAPPEPPKP
jgi:thiol-disulfide isomerase/thioredoxin